MQRSGFDAELGTASGGWDGSTLLIEKAAGTCPRVWCAAAVMSWRWPVGRRAATPQSGVLCCSLVLARSAGPGHSAGWPGAVRRVRARMGGLRSGARAR